MFKSLFFLAALALLITACSDKAANTSELLSPVLSSSNSELVKSSSEDATGEVVVTDEIVNTQHGVVSTPGVKTLAEMIAEDPNFHPDTVYAIDFIVPDGNCSGPGCSHATKRDYTTGEVLSDITYDFSSLLTGDHVVLYENGAFSVWIDKDD